jgi:hypothetical protein
MHFRPLNVSPLSNVRTASDVWRIEMNWRCNPPKRASQTDTRNNHLHPWVLSLPWVVERPGTPGIPGVRTFAIACEPLDVHRLWLVTGLPSGQRVAVIVPDAVALDWELQGIGHAISPMPAGFTFLGARHDADDSEVERMVLEAYGTALS